MSSSLWSITSDRSSSSLSWEEESDKESEKYIQNLLEGIDKIVFGNGFAPELPDLLRQECLLWRKKFADKLAKDFTKKTVKAKTLSAPEINAKSGSKQRSLSEQTFVFPKTTLESIPNKSNAKRERPNGLNRHLMNNQKPLILPPLVNVNQSRGQVSKIPVVSTAQPNAKTGTSFPKPVPVLSLDQILKRTHNYAKEEKSTKLSILPHIDNKVYNRSNKPILPAIK